jgi:hypothetical protein
LGNSGKVPIVFCTEGRTLETGDVDLGLIKCYRTSLDEENLGGWEAFAETRSDGYSRSAASDDDLTRESKVRTNVLQKTRRVGGS